MENMQDTLKAAIETGFLHDSCGSDDRHYAWGTYLDLCGMPVEDAIPASPCVCKKETT